MTPENGLGEIKYQSYKLNEKNTDTGKSVIWRKECHTSQLESPLPQGFILN